MGVWPRLFWKLTSAPRDSNKNSTGQDFSPGRTCGPNQITVNNNYLLKVEETGMNSAQRPNKRTAVCLETL